MCTGTPVHYEQKVCGTEWAGQAVGCGECVLVHRYTMSKLTMSWKVDSFEGGKDHSASVCRCTGTP
jgi:hypothetical protein